MNNLQPKGEIGVAIIGMGYMGTHHFRVLKQLEKQGVGCRVVGVCDLRQERLDELEKGRKLDLGLSATSPQELLQRDDVDAVYITTPSFNHMDLVRMAAKAGKNVYCEKPLAGCAENVSEMAELLKSSNVQGQAGLLLRHQPSLWKLKSIIDSGELGDVTFVSLREDSSLPKQGPVFQTDLDLRLDGRGILWEENIHDLDMLLSLFGDLTVWDVDLRYHPSLGRAETGAFLKLSTDNNVPVIFNSYWHEIEGRLASRHLEVFFGKGVIISDYFTSGDLIVQKSGDKPRTLNKADLLLEYINAEGLPECLKNQRVFPGNWYASFADASFIGALLNDQSVTPSFEDSLKAHKIIETVYLMSLP